MLSIVSHIRKLRGGSQPHLMQVSDGSYYVVKLQGNPQGTKVLANELLASRIAERIGLPVPRAEIVYLPEEIAAEINFETPEGKLPVCSGIHCGLRIVICPLKGRMYEVLPSSELRKIRNRTDLVGAELFDFWTRNLDQRQQIYWRRCAEKKFSVCFIDNGHCFGGPEWKFDRTAHPFHLTEFDEQRLREWIKRIEGVRRAELSMLAAEIPAEWYGNDSHALNSMLDELFAQSSLLQVVAQTLGWAKHSFFPIDSNTIGGKESIAAGSLQISGYDDQYGTAQEAAVNSRISPIASDGVAQPAMNAMNLVRIN